MKIKSFDHISINCRDPEASFRFYEQILGLKKLKETDLGTHVLHNYDLFGVSLDLIVYRNPQKEIESGNTDTGIYRHMALIVDDLDEAYNQVKEAGCKINLEPKYIPALDDIIFLFVDPNGVEIEMIQAK